MWFETSENGETPLITAASMGYVGVVQLLLTRADVDVNKPKILGLTPLDRACASILGNGEIAKLLRMRHKGAGSGYLSFLG